jgi:hypothetical protein
MSAARFAGWNPFTILTWGFARKASLHPRLYACACFAGWETTSFQKRRHFVPLKSCQEAALSNGSRPAVLEWDEKICRERCRRNFVGRGRQKVRWTHLQNRRNQGRNKKEWIGSIAREVGWTGKLTVLDKAQLPAANEKHCSLAASIGNRYITYSQRFYGFSLDPAGGRSLPQESKSAGKSGLVI